MARISCLCAFVVVLLVLACSDLGRTVDKWTRLINDDRIARDIANFGGKSP